MSDSSLNSQCLEWGFAHTASVSKGTVLSFNLKETVICEHILSCSLEVTQPANGYFCMGS